MQIACINNIFKLYLRVLSTKYFPIAHNTLWAMGKYLVESTLKYYLKILNSNILHSLSKTVNTKSTHPSVADILFTSQT